MHEMSVLPGPNEHHGFVDAAMLWPWTTTFSERVDAAQRRLREIYLGAKLRWNEAETIRRIIFPILTEILGYPGDDLTETPEEIQRHGNNRLHPDFFLPGICVIEAKRMKVSLLRYSAEASKFTNPLDQGITYLDNYDARICIITNGWDWYFIVKNVNRDQFTSTNIINYYGLRFRLDEAASSDDTTRLEQFLSMVHYTCMPGAANNCTAINGFSHYELPRKLCGGRSYVYFADFSEGPMKGQGSGFNF